MINENMCSVERNEVAWNRQEAREGFWSEHHDLLSCRAWCRETHLQEGVLLQGVVQGNTPDCSYKKGCCYKKAWCRETHQVGATRRGARSRLCRETHSIAGYLKGGVRP